MTKLYSSNFDADTDGSIPTGWATKAGAGYFVQPGTTGGNVLISGAKAYIAANPGDETLYTGTGALTDQGIRSAIRINELGANFRAASHIIRMNTSPGALSNGYACVFTNPGGNSLSLTIQKVVGGTGSDLATAATGLTPTSTDVVHFETISVSNVIECRVWLNSATRPTSPTVTATDSTYPSGYIGMRHEGASAWGVADNVVVADGPSGLDFFYSGADTTSPTVSSAAVSNSTPSVVNLTMSEAMDTGNVPAASAFTVSGHTVSSVAITGSTINLTVSAAFVNGEAARTVAYTQPGTANARDVAGNLLASFTGQAITNNVAATDTTAPTFSSAQVANAAPTNIVITMSETLAAFTPAASAFAVSGGKTVSNVARSGATITLTCSAAYAFGDTITVTYTKPGTNMLQDAAGNQTASFGPSSVTNNVAAVGGGTVTITSPSQGGKRVADGTYRSSVACNVTALDKTTHAVLERKTGLTSPASGPLVFTSTVLAAGTERLFLVKADADDKDIGMFFATPV